MTAVPLKFYVSRRDYAVMAGPDWPSYEDYLAGKIPDNNVVKQEIQDWTQTQIESGVHFPIETQPACVYKWTWSAIYLNMLSTASCHRAGNMPIPLDDFDNFHNLPKKLEDRNKMLNGEWPQGGCYYCQSIEEAGGKSDRLLSLGIRGITPPEVLVDSRAVEVSPRIIEIFAQNTCNLACIYCNDALSSKIEQENKKFGSFDKNGLTIKPSNLSNQLSDQYFEKFINWLERNIKSLRRLHLLGGETFIQHDLMTRVLDIIAKNPNPDLEFCTFSNLNAPAKHWYGYLDQIKQLQKAGNIRIFDLTASIDCWGPQQSYVRSGLDLDRFEEYFAWASEQDSNWLRLNVNQTITSMTIRTMPELIDKIAHYSKFKEIGHYFQFIGPASREFDPNHAVEEVQHPKYFGYSTWSQDFDNILSAMPQGTEGQRESIERMIGQQKLLQQSREHNYQVIDKLHTYLDELDRRRGTDWRALFPYLDIHP